MPQPEGAELDAIRARREELKKKYLHAPAERPASTVRGVHHLALIAKDVEETIRFYQDFLGFPLVELVENRDYRGSSHFFFDIGNRNLLGFFDFPGHDHPDVPGDDRRRPAPRAVHHAGRLRRGQDEARGGGHRLPRPGPGHRQQHLPARPQRRGIEFYVQELGVFEGQELLGTASATGSS